MAKNRALNNITIGHWNANGIQGNYREFVQFLRDHNIDIMMLNETKLKIGARFNVKGYSVVRCVRSNAKAQGGVAILIHENLNFLEVKLNTTSLETVAIKLNDSTIIVAAYGPPSIKINNTDLDVIFNLGNKVLLFGDLNSKHQAWNCRASNINGRFLYTYALKNTITLLQPDNFTLYPYNNALPSIVDIGLSKNICSISDIGVYNELNSDHMPIVFTMNNTINKVLKTRQFFYYKDANWPKFREILNQKIIINKNINSTSDIDKEVENFIKCINEAADSTIPKQRAGTFHIHLPHNIKQLIDNRNKLPKIFQRTANSEIKKIHTQLSNKIKRSIKKFYNNEWTYKLTNLNIQDNSLWKMAKCLTRKNNSNKISALHGKRGVAVSDIEKAEVLAEHYESVHRLTENYSNRKISRKVNDVYCEIAAKEVDNSDVELTNPSEIGKAIMRTGSRKAPERDGVQNILLKNLSRKAIVQMTYIFNSCLMSSYFPDLWKVANILPFHKVGKDKLFAASYRPVSLLPTVSKVFERIIYNRIKKFEINNKILINDQFGFRNNRNTVQQLLRVTNHISANFNKNISTLMVLLDLEKAFDTVWHKGLIYKFKKLIYPFI